MSTSKQLKILLVGSKITTGGAELTLLSLAQWLLNKGQDVTAAFFYDPSGLLGQWQQTYQFPIICLKAWSSSGAKFKNILVLAVRWFGLVGWMRKQKFDAVVCFTHDSNSLVLPAAWLAGIPIRYGSHHGRFSKMTPIRYWLHSKLINSTICSGLIAVSTHIRNQAVEEGINPDRITTIFNGIDFSTLVSRQGTNLKKDILGQQRGPLILNIGRLVVEKDQKTLVRSAEIVLKKNPEAVFIIVGEGYLKEELVSLISSLDLQKSVRMFGYRADIPDLLGAADLFVLSSISEGMPISLLQAMGAGIPIISTQIGGVADIISNGENGILVPPGDPQSLAEAILRLTDDAVLTKKLAKNGCRKVHTFFSLERMGQEYLKLLMR